MSSPTVTVIVPCFDHGASLPMALASVLAQTIDDWECIVVDDGSEVPVAPLVDAFDDPRFRHFAFDDNRGRPVARQKGLDAARGDYVCMLDADDWFYPDKLERQLDVFAAHPDVAGVTTSLAVHDGDGRLLGIRTATRRRLELRKGTPLRAPVGAFPPYMLRGDLARAHNFDATLERSEDRDYLTRALTGHCYAVMRRVGYAYSETYSNETMRAAVVGFHCQRRTYLHRLDEAPAVACRQLILNAVKTAVYFTARRLGIGRWLFTRRNEPPTADQLRRFRDHRARIGQQVHRLQRVTPTSL